MAIKITWATTKDVDKLYDLDKIAHKENKFWNVQTKASFRKIIKKSKFLTIIAFNNNKPVGYLQSGMKNTKIHLWIENIFVVKKYRKKGIARLLVKRFTSHWKSRVENIVLITSDRNLRIFKRLGFKKEMNYMNYKKK